MGLRQVGEVRELGNILRGLLLRAETMGWSQRLGEGGALAHQEMGDAFLKRGKL